MKPWAPIKRFAKSSVHYSVPPSRDDFSNRPTTKPWQIWFSPSSRKNSPTLKTGGNVGLPIWNSLRPVLNIPDRSGGAIFISMSKIPPNYTCIGHNLRFFSQRPSEKRPAARIRLPGAKRPLPRAPRPAPRVIKRRGAVLSRLALKSQTMTVASIVVDD